MKRLLLLILCVSSVVFAADKDVRIPQFNSTTGAWPNVTVSPAANSLAGFSSDKTFADVTIGSGLSLSAGILTSTGGLPSQGGNAGKFLTTNGTAASWATISGGGDLLAANNLSDLASIPTGRSNLQVVYPTANQAVSANIVTWTNSMGVSGTTGNGIPWPSWLAVRTGRTVDNQGVAGETSTQIKARFDAAPAKRGNFAIFDVARNDTNFTTTKANIAAMIATLTTDRYLVIGVLCRQSTPVGNAQHTLDIQLNADLLALYGDRFFDPQTYMVGMWDPNSAQDVTDHTNEVFPTSLTGDGTHYNNAGHIAFADRVTPIVLHSIGASSTAFTTDVTITKSAPTLSLINTGAGTGSFSLATTAAAGQFRITESGVADRFVISKTTGYTGVGTTSPLAPFVVSNAGGAGIEFTPSSGAVLWYNRTSSAYAPSVQAASTFSFSIGGTQKLGIDASGNSVFAGTLAATSAAFSGDITVTKSAPTLNLANTGAGGKTFSLETTATAGDFRITEVGVADRLTILPTTGYMGVGTTLPVAPFVVSNGGALGLEIDPTISTGTQVNVLAYNRGTSAYRPLAFGSSAFSFTQGDITLTKSAPTIALANTDTGGATYNLATTAAAGQFRITEVGVADRFTISKTTGYVGIGTTAQLAPLVVSNGGALGLEIDPTISSGTQVNIAAYNRGTSAYKPIAFGASAYSFATGNVQVDGILSAGSGPVIHTNAAGNILPAALTTGALANGMTATTQSAADNSTKLATTAYADAAAAARGNVTNSGTLTLDAIALGAGTTVVKTTTTGTGVVTALGVNTGSVGAFVVNGGALGTPSSGTMTNVGGTAASLTAGNATTLATARAIYGNNFDGSAALTQVIASTYGGTGNGFAKLSGPATSEKTFTLPNASAAILTDNAAVTVAQGGTGLTAGTSGGIPYYSSTSAMTSSAALATSNIVIGGGAGAAPSTTTTGSNILTALSVAPIGAGNIVLSNPTINEQTGTSYTLAVTDLGKKVLMRNASASTVTINDTANTTFTVNSVIILGQRGAGQVTVSPQNGNVTIQARASANKLAGQYSDGVLTLESISGSATIWNLNGDITP